MLNANRDRVLFFAFRTAGLRPASLTLHRLVKSKFKNAGRDAGATRMDQRAFLFPRFANALHVSTCGAG